MPNYGLGRIHKPDPRDELFLMASLPQAAVPKPFGYHLGNMRLDQGSTPHCVEFSWHHYVQTGRIRPQRSYPYWTPHSLYPIMQQNDHMPGEDYAGTTVRAGAKVLADYGYISEYFWAWDLETIIDTVTRIGPVVIGTNWYPSMWQPDELGIVKIEGNLAGGHAYLIDGANRKLGMARCKNSYGKAWGINGRFWMPFEVLERLLDENGEACIAVEART